MKQYAETMNWNKNRKSEETTGIRRKENQESKEKKIKNQKKSRNQKKIRKSDKNEQI